MYEDLFFYISTLILWTSQMLMYQQTAHTCGSMVLVKSKNKCRIILRNFTWKLSHSFLCSVIDSATTNRFYPWSTLTSFLRDYQDVMFLSAFFFNTPSLHDRFRLIVLYCNGVDTEDTYTFHHSNYNILYTAMDVYDWN